MINEEYNNLPRDVIKSLAKMEKIMGKEYVKKILIDNPGKITER